MGDPRQTLRQQQIREAKAREATYALQQAKLKALQDTIGSYGNFQYVDLEDFIDPNNQNWADYKYYVPDPRTYLSGLPAQGHVNAGTPVGIFIQKIRDAENIGDVYKQSELWNSHDPLSSRDRARKYFRDMFGGKEPDPVQATAGDAQGVQGVQAGTQGTQGVVTVGGAQGAQAGVQAGAGVAKGDTASAQGTQTGGTSGGTQGAKTGDTGGTYASSGVPKGGTKTIGYDPNPGNVSLAYAMRNAPEQERRAALIDEWNQEHGISYVTGKDGLIYRIDPQHPNGYVDPFKNDFSAWKTAWKTGSTYASSDISNGSTYASPSVSTGGTYATGEGIKDANGNVLTNPGGDWEYQLSLRDPQYGLGMMSKMSDAQKKYLQAVSDDMGYKYNFTGAARYV